MDFPQPASTRCSQTVSIAAHPAALTDAAMACVMAAKHDKPVEFSVGAAKSEGLPTAEEWEEIMGKMEV